MHSAKERMLDIVAKMPDDATFEEIWRELTLERVIQRGLDDSQNGRVISHEEMGRRIRSWAKEPGESKPPND